MKLNVIVSESVEETAWLNNREENFIQKNILLSVWRDIQGIFHHEMVNINRTITSNSYRNQLHRLKADLGDKSFSFVNRNDSFSIMIILVLTQLIWLKIKKSSVRKKFFIL